MDKLVSWPNRSIVGLVVYQRTHDCTHMHAVHDVIPWHTIAHGVNAGRAIANPVSHR